MDPEQVHEVLTKQFTDVYIQRQHIGAIAFSAPYEPATDPFCDYDSTWWEAKPNKWSTRLGPPVVSKINRLNQKEFEELFVAPLTEKADDITDALREYPVAFINGHSLDLQAALPLVAGSIGIARAAKQGEYQRNLEDMVRVSHAIATRAIAPIRIRRPWLPPSFPFMRIAQLVVNPHMSFPRNKRMAESGIAESFMASYNAKLKADCIAVAETPSEHPLGYRTLWALAPGGTPDIKIKEESEHQGKTITKKVEPATIHLIQRMGCALVPVYMSFRDKNDKDSKTVAKLGSIIPPGKVTGSTLPDMMADLARYRRANGEPDVYYEEELAS